MINVICQIHNHIRFFENLQDRLEVDFDKMSDASKQKIFDNFTSLDRLQYEVREQFLEYGYLKNRICLFRILFIFISLNVMLKLCMEVDGFG